MFGRFNSPQASDRVEIPNDKVDLSSEDNHAICECGEYEEAHTDGLCPSARDYGKKFKPAQSTPSTLRIPEKKGCGKWFKINRLNWRNVICRKGELCPECEVGK